jgi:hypothetical protein
MAEAAIAGYRFVKPGAADGGLLQSALATNKITGISTQAGGALGDQTDYIVSGEAELQLGGAVTRGDRLTSDANGKGVTTVTAGDILGAIALANGVADDIIPVIVIYGKQ